MTWHSGPQDLHKLKELGTLTARLIRLTAFVQLSRGEAQLRARGASISFTDLYKEFARAEADKLKEKPTKKIYVKVTPSKESTF